MEPFLSPADWMRTVIFGAAFALGLGAFYIGMLWFGGI